MMIASHADQGITQFERCNIFVLEILVKYYMYHWNYLMSYLYMLNINNYFLKIRF